MGFFNPIAEFITYLLFSVLVGHAALQFVPAKYKPEVFIPVPFLLLSALGIIFFTFFPVLQVILYFQESIGLGSAALSVLTDFQVGKAWIFIGFAATFLYLTIYAHGSKYLQALWLVLMIMAIGYASHVSSLSFWYGLINHSIHFVVAASWVGILLNVAWFSTDNNNWGRFLRWFTPFAVICLVMIIVSGLLVMFLIVEPKAYMKAWVLPYGQMLLLKHISIIPVVVFAVINGILSKKGKDFYDLRPWIKAETIVLMIVFFFTGVMGTLSPPHEADLTVSTEGAARWVELLINKEIVSPFQAGLSPSSLSVLFLFISILFLLCMIISHRRKLPFLGVVFACCLIVAIYMALMLAFNIVA
ncbi:copper resistance D family protein [Peribacillus glennii]|uniref:Copper resistance protein D domain-containing protein n=1 Tax=Peribacillus glennii TaxID=2303991 RepID=A0A372L913_9BACI|nr:CopD family protein [Peribacillus glennii]RFU62032.1 hypothetical protein D0466_15700 [Peribacillus glennii]